MTHVLTMSTLTDAIPNRMHTTGQAEVNDTRTTSFSHLYAIHKKHAFLEQAGKLRLSNNAEAEPFSAVLPTPRLGPDTQAQLDTEYAIAATEAEQAQLIGLPDLALTLLHEARAVHHAGLAEAYAETNAKANAEANSNHKPANQPRFSETLRLDADNAPAPSVHSGAGTRAPLFTLKNAVDTESPPTLRPAYQTISRLAPPEIELEFLPADSTRAIVASENLDFQPRPATDSSIQALASGLTAHPALPSHGSHSVSPGAFPLSAPQKHTVSLHDPEWTGRVGSYIIKLAQQDNSSLQTAEIRVDPPELGPLRISLHVLDGVTHALISSAHASVRQTLEQSLGQLQTQLEQEGLSLGQADVSDHSNKQQFDQAMLNFSKRTARLSASLATETGPANSLVAGTDSAAVPRAAGNLAPNALVDTYV